MTTDLKKTPLYQNYVDSGAKIVEFGGWAMPVQFSSIKEEHNAVYSALESVRLLVSLDKIYCTKDLASFP